jgi:hypothetical protein
MALRGLGGTISAGGSIAFPIQSGQTGIVSSGGAINVSAGGAVQILTGGALNVFAGGSASFGSLTILGSGSAYFGPSGSFNSAAVAEFASGAGAIFDSGANIVTLSGASLQINAGTLIPTSAANTLNSALATDAWTPGYTNGRWYGAHYLQPTNAVGAAPLGGFVVACPVRIDYPVKIDAMGCSVVSAAGSGTFVSFGIYSAQGNNNASANTVVGATLLSATTTATLITSTTGSGATSGLFAAPFTLPAGWYWFALSTTGGSTFATVLNTNSAAQQYVFGQTTPGAAMTTVGYFTSWANGTMSANWNQVSGGALTAANAMETIMVRASS